MERMNSRERMIASIERAEVDRVPVCPPFQGYWALGYGGINVKNSIDDPKASAAAQMKVTEICGFDAIETMWDWLSIVEEMGCEVKIPEMGSIPTWTHIVEDAESLDKLELPDPTKDYRLESSMETTRILIDEIGKEKMLYMTLVSPFTLVGELRGVEALMIDTFTEPDFVKDILDYATQALKLYSEHCMSSGVDGVILCDPTASGSLISKESFEEFGQPYMRACGEVVKANDGRVMVHICGDTNDRLETVASVGADVFSVDSLVDLALASKEIGDHQTLLGNVKPPQTLFSGTPEASYQESVECIRATGGKGFILGAGCDIAPETPIDNVKAMFKAATEYEY